MWCDEIVTACTAAGLVVNRRMNSLLRDRDYRLVCVWASRRGWPHAAPMFEVQAAVLDADRSIEIV